MTTEQRFFLLRSQLTIIRQADILAARNEIKKILLQIRSGAGDGMDFVLANHFPQRDAQFRRAHRSRECDHHFSTSIEVSDVGIGSVFQDSGVKMPVVAINELANAAHLHFQLFHSGPLAFDAKLLPRQSSANRAFPENFFTVRRQGSALPGSLVLCPAKELLPQAQPPWLATADPAGHRCVARRRAQVNQRKSPSVPSGSSKAR